MASSLKFLAQHKSRDVDSRDRMKQQALAQTGVDAPKTAGRKEPGSGIAAAFLVHGKSRRGPLIRTWCG
jgi:hypothetical protein